MIVSDSTPGFSSANWAGDTSQRWAAHAERLEAMLAPVDGILLPAAAIATGERVLDIGCGRGVTARAVALSAGPSGAVSGVDISPTLIAEAQVVAPSPGSAPLSWICADAAAHSFDHGAFDVIVSRFGVMFFDHPVAAFANLGAAVCSGGRLAAAVWQRQDAAEFQWLSIQVALRVAAAAGVVLVPEAPDAGPYAYGSHDHTVGILEAAGWVDISVEPHSLPLYVGGPGTTPEQAVQMGRQVGPLGILLRSVEPGLADAISAALIEEMNAHWDGTGIALCAGIAIVNARRR